MPITWHPMQDRDVQHVTTLANSIHTDYPETEDIFAERLALYPLGCLVLKQDTAIRGYIISHPWQQNNIPELNNPIGNLPSRADTHYIHDIAIHPALRGGGWTGRALQHMRMIALSAGFDTLSLVSVGDAYGFWCKQSFEDIDLPSLKPKLLSYDAQARYMRRSV